LFERRKSVKAFLSSGWTVCSWTTPRKYPNFGVAEIERLISRYPSQRMMALRALVSASTTCSKNCESSNPRRDFSALPEGENGFLIQTGKLRPAVADARTTDISMAFGSGKDESHNISQRILI
jgi:hypothetical protein